MVNQSSGILVIFFYLFIIETINQLSKSFEIFLFKFGDDFLSKLQSFLASLSVQPVWTYLLVSSCFCLAYFVILFINLFCSFMQLVAYLCGFWVSGSWFANIKFHLLKIRVTGGPKDGRIDGPMGRWMNWQTL